MAEHDADDKGATPDGVSGGKEHVANRDPSSEWTASDRRGTTSAADEEEVERYVPSSEMDAVGERDHTPVHFVPGGEPHPLAEPQDSLPVENDTLPARDDASPAQAGHPTTTDIEPMPTADGPAHDPNPKPLAGSSAATAHDPAALAESQKPASRWPIAAGLLIGAIVGAGSAGLVYVYDGGTPGGDIAGLTSRLNALENPPLRPDVDALKTSVADLQARLKAPPPSVAAPEKPAETSAAVAPVAAPAQDPELPKTVASLQSGLESLRGQIDDLAKRGAANGDLATKLATLETAVAYARKQAEGAQADISTVETRQKSLEGKVGAPALAVVADSLVQQIDQGQPYATQVEALGTLGADPARLAVLRQNADKGVPSAKALLARFTPLADPVAATVEKAPANASFWDKLKHGASSIVSVRNANDTSGNDLASRVALIQADLAHDDVTGALAAWDALPADAKKKSDAWGALAKTSAEAIGAARELQRDAIGALAAKKS